MHCRCAVTLLDQSLSRFPDLDRNIGKAAIRAEQTDRALHSFHLTVAWQALCHGRSRRVSVTQTCTPGREGFVQGPPNDGGIEGSATDVSSSGHLGISHYNRVSFAAAGLSMTQCQAQEKDILVQ